MDMPVPSRRTLGTAVTRTGATTAEFRTIFRVAGTRRRRRNRLAALCLSRYSTRGILVRRTAHQAGTTWSASPLSLLQAPGGAMSIPSLATGSDLWTPGLSLIAPPARPAAISAYTASRSTSRGLTDAKSSAPPHEEGEQPAEGKEGAESNRHLAGAEPLPGQHEQRHRGGREQTRNDRRGDGLAECRAE